jgi:hypothetical protein
VKVSTLFLTLFALTACQEQASQQSVATEESVNVSFASRPPEQQPHVPYRNPSCEDNSEGKYNTFGNRYTRFSNICIDEVSLRFEAFSDFSITYEMKVYGCDEESSIWWVSDARFFRRAVSEQILILERSLTNDFRKLSAKCKIGIDPIRFLGPKFSDFYYSFGDGWWFSRLKNGIVLTPEKGTDYRNAEKN